MRSFVDCSKEDVTQTIYIGGLSQPQSSPPSDVKSSVSADKVDSVCEAVKSAVERVDADRFS